MANVSSVPDQTITKRFTFSNARDNVRHTTTNPHTLTGQGVPVIFSVTAPGSGYSADDNTTLSLNNPATNGGTGATGMTITVGGGAVQGVSNPNLNGRGYRVGDILNVEGGGSNATVKVDAVQYTMGQIPDNAVMDIAIIDCSTPFATAAGTSTVAVRIGSGPAASGTLNKTVKTNDHDATPWTGEQFKDDIVAKADGVLDVILLVSSIQNTAGDASVWVRYCQGV